ncbi:quinol dehydrogenase ferredoxin subunit NapH [Halarcobacter anaerophilus]|uniref:Quinol dehydrogenase ferredoxin subunit NapH n=1 Tax=Halarcobacter anaerophilus TaxID=877500 RepID=A0A4Q0Y3U9_9BACT|nr:quinol dehydrogenase ferredoxin subunit NapH [Halarcobacter anaerophilus]QDF29632.1 menaquinol dehydrogenase NapGH, membrane component NapH [Halarcobacter anaerophilus]RXJ64866.1 quinol dehydrogenase ferredoxin subunit NapH [Halarcobacter anaerophilus]
MMNNKFLILRRFTQISIMFLYFAANAWGWNFLIGNLSSSKILNLIPMSDPYAVLQMFVSGAIIASDVFVGALIVVLFYSIIGGRAFCSWVCPVNMITDLANYTRRKFGLNRIQKKQPATRNMRYWIIALSLIISFIFAVPAFEFISPISMIHRGIVFGLGFGWAAILMIFLFDLFVLKNGWCGHICPLGGFYSLIGRFSLIKVEHQEEKCTLCMKCKEVCPESQVLFMVGKESGQVLSAECTNCGRCIEVCEDDAMNFSIRDLIANKKKEK